MGGFSITATRTATALPSVRTMMAVSPPRFPAISPFAADFQHRFVVGRVLDLVGQVFGRPVRIGAGDCQLLPGVRTDQGAPLQGPL